MDVSQTSSAPIQENMNKEPEAQSVLKKAQEVQEQQILKTLENTTEQSHQMTAQKTGMGNNINLTA